VAEVLRRCSSAAVKPMLGCFLAWPEMTPLLKGIPGEPDSAMVPAFASPEPAAHALARAADYAIWRARPPGALPDLEDFDVEHAGKLIEAFLVDTPDGGWLPAETVDELLRAAGVHTIANATATNPVDAARAAATLGFPVALKAVGRDVVHKSDVGGVRLGLQSEQEVADAYTSMADQVGDRMTGATVQQMATPGVETIVGVVHHRLFGPLVMFGMGGVATELLDDRSFRILPVTDADAAELVRSLRAGPLLFGYRGSPALAVNVVEDVLQRVARLAAEVPELLELEMNPVIVSPTDAVAVDARIKVVRTPPGAAPDVRQMP
jgi:acyl-CoA synthetase (NDP forming)